MIRRKRDIITFAILFTIIFWATGFFFDGNNPQNESFQKMEGDKG